MKTFAEVVLKALVSVCLLVSSNAAEKAKPFCFIQFTDPQFGLYRNDAGFEQETANFEFAIAAANRLKPAFVIVTGDLINKTADPGESSEYLRITARIERSIPLYNVPGNHDLDGLPLAEGIAMYKAKFGPDYYAFESHGMIGIVLNSTLINSPEDAPQLAEAQDKWLVEELDKAKKNGAPHILVFQHHPWSQPPWRPASQNQEELAKRSQRSARYMNMFREYGVKHVFTGHYHRNQVTQDGSVEMVVTQSIGMPLGGDGKSGMRIVIVRDDKIEHRFYELCELPSQIDLGEESDQSDTGN